MEQQGPLRDSKERRNPDGPICYRTWIAELDKDIAYAKKLRDETELRLQELRRTGDDDVGFSNSLIVSSESLVLQCKNCLAFFAQEKAKYLAFALEDEENGDQAV